MSLLFYLGGAGGWGAKFSNTMGMLREATLLLSAPRPLRLALPLGFRRERAEVSHSSLGGIVTTLRASQRTSENFNIFLERSCARWRWHILDKQGALAGLRLRVCMCCESFSVRALCCLHPRPPSHFNGLVICLPGGDRIIECGLCERRNPISRQRRRWTKLERRRDRRQGLRRCRRPQGDACWRRQNGSRGR